MQFSERFLIAPVLLLLLQNPCAAEDSPERFAVFNVRVGTQTFGPKYTFSDTETTLVETARRIHEMGSDIIKFALKPETEIGRRSIHSLAETAEKDTACRSVLDMPFRFYQMWVYPLSVEKKEIKWRDGLDAGEAAIEYREIYDLTRHLLTQYNGSRKSFYLGHWEGDWTLLGHYEAEKDPTDQAIKGFTDYLKNRQQAVDDARRDTPHEEVDVRHYTEVNLVTKAVKGGRSLTNNVLPNVKVDLVSYSSYDGLGRPFPDKLLQNLDYVTSMARTKGPLQKNIFLGEYGYPIAGGKRTPEKQAEETAELIKAAGGWGCPFILYWEMYDNESGDERKGFWLINQRNEKQPSYAVHESFLGRAHAFKNLYRFWLRRNPTEKEFSAFCKSFDTFRTSKELARILDSEEFCDRLGPREYMSFLVKHLHRCRSRSTQIDGEFKSYENCGSRLDVLKSILDGEWYAKQRSNEDFCDRLTAAGFDRNSTSTADLHPHLRSAAWLSFIDSEDFYRAELPIRTIDEKDSPAIAAKYLP
jgi:hypothetical protein